MRACHTDMEVCLVVLSATSTCVGLLFYYKGRVPVDPVHVTHYTIDGMLCLYNYICSE